MHSKRMGATTTAATTHSSTLKVASNQVHNEDEELVEACQEAKEGHKPRAVVKANMSTSQYAERLQLYLQYLWHMLHKAQEQGRHGYGEAKHKYICGLAHDN